MPFKRRHCECISELISHMYVSIRLHTCIHVFPCIHFFWWWCHVDNLLKHLCSSKDIFSINVNKKWLQRPNCHEYGWYASDAVADPYWRHDPQKLLILQDTRVLSPSGPSVPLIWSISMFLMRLRSTLHVCVFVCASDKCEGLSVSQIFLRQARSTPTPLFRICWRLWVEGGG